MVDSRKKKIFLVPRKRKRKVTPIYLFSSQLKSQSAMLRSESDFMRSPTPWGKRNIRCLIERDRVIMPNGQHYLYPVAKLEIPDTPQISQEEIEALDLSLNIVYTESTIIKDSEIFATGRKIHSVKEAKELYRKISIDPSSAVSYHRILFYRFFLFIEQTTGMTGSTERDVSC